MVQQLFKKVTGIAAGALLLVLLASCVQAPEPSGPPVTLSPGFSAAGEVPLADSWWTAFDSDHLNQLVGQSLESNFDLLVAWERLQEARAVVDRSSAEWWPTLDLGLDGQAQRPETGSGDFARLGAYSGYEIDLWGRIGSRVEAERFRAAATEADYRTARLTLSAEVAATWFRLLTASGQLELVRSQLETNSKILDSLRNRFGAGQGERADLLRQEQLLEASREQLHISEARVQVLRHQLSILVGDSPLQGAFPTGDGLPDLPPLPETGLTADLLQRRPDLRAAFNRLRAADHELAAAVAERYPRISLSASVTTEENDLTDFFDEWVRSLAGNLLLPVVDGGSRRAEVARAEAVRRQQLYAYGQAVLLAVREVEDALVVESRQSLRLQSLQEQVRLSRESYLQLQRQYINGAGNFLDVLTALTNEQGLRRGLLEARLDLMENRINLYRALGGGTGAGELN